MGSRGSSALKASMTPAIWSSSDVSSLAMASIDAMRRVTVAAIYCSTVSSA